MKDAFSQHVDPLSPGIQSPLGQKSRKAPAQVYELTQQYILRQFEVFLKWLLILQILKGPHISSEKFTFSATNHGMTVF